MTKAWKGGRDVVTKETLASERTKIKPHNDTEFVLHTEPFQFDALKQHDLFTLVHGAHEVVEGDLTGRGCIYEAPDKVRLTTAKSRNAGDKAARALAKRAK